MKKGRKCEARWYERVDTGMREKEIENEVQWRTRLHELKLRICLSLYEKCDIKRFFETAFEICSTRFLIVNVHIRDHIIMVNMIIMIAIIMLCSHYQLFWVTIIEYVVQYRPLSSGST